MDKPAGITSHDVVARIRRLFGTRAVGHTGTLDPFATGLLVLVLGGATRLARFVEAGSKTYRAVARLGTRTDTDDATGSRVGEEWAGPWPSEAAVASALAEEVGVRNQQPPRFSAKQVGGRRSHEVARRGGVLDLAAVPVRVEQIVILGYQPPGVEFRAVVGPGTYLRAIARDVGARLGTGAHLTDLRREQVGRFAVEDAIPLASVTGQEPLLPPVDLVSHLRRVPLSEAEQTAVRQGRQVGDASTEGPVALVHGGALVAVAEARHGRWQPVVVLAE